MRYQIKTIKVTLDLNDNSAEFLSGQVINSGVAAYNILHSIYSQLEPDQEHFTILAVDNKHNITGYKTIFTGGQTRTGIDMKVLFRNVLLFGAAAFVVCHNHPSGDPTPGKEDIEVTRKIHDAAKLLDLRLLDHIVLGAKGSYCSFTEQNISMNLADTV